MFERLVDFLLRPGSYPEEPEEQRARRRIIVVAVWIASGFTVLNVLGDYASGYDWVGRSNIVVVFLLWLMLFGMHLYPRRFAMWVTAGFAVALSGCIDEAEVGRFSCFKEALLKSDGKMFSESVADETAGGNHVPVFNNGNSFCS